MLTIYKYMLPSDAEIIGGMNAVEFNEIPAGAKILKIAKQDNDNCLWAMVDTDNENKKYVICFMPTGIELTKDILNWNYLDTLILCNGAFVYHVYWKEYGEATTN